MLYPSDEGDSFWSDDPEYDPLAAYMAALAPLPLDEIPVAEEDFFAPPLKQTPWIRSNHVAWGLGPKLPHGE